METRTLEDYVEDMVSDGKSPDDVWAVARQTRWATVADEAREQARKLLGL